jgi:hypothetical protein
MSPTGLAHKSLIEHVQTPVLDGNGPGYAGISNRKKHHVSTSCFYGPSKMETRRQKKTDPISLFHPNKRTPTMFRLKTYLIIITTLTLHINKSNIISYYAI